MPRGGRRTGAGRKPGGKKRPAPPAVVLGMDGARLQTTAAALPSVVDVVALAVDPADPLLIPPAGMPDNQRAIWTARAPHAIAQGTLIPATVVGFAELCEQAAMKAELWG